MFHLSTCRQRHLRQIDFDKNLFLQAQEVAVDTDLALLQEREERIRQLESDILDVNEIFRDLGALVHEQGETIDTIENNVEEAYNQVRDTVDVLQNCAADALRDAVSNVFAKSESSTDTSECSEEEEEV